MALSTAKFGAKFEDQTLKRRRLGYVSQIFIFKKPRIREKMMRESLKSSKK
jgi:hypothetical protein